MISVTKEEFTKTKEDFKTTLHGHLIVQLRDLIMQAPDGPERNKAIGLLKEIFDSAAGLWMLKGKTDGNP